MIKFFKPLTTNFVRSMSILMLLLISIAMLVAAFPVAVDARHGPLGNGDSGEVWHFKDKNTITLQNPFLDTTVHPGDLVDFKFDSRSGSDLLYTAILTFDDDKIVGFAITVSEDEILAAQNNDDPTPIEIQGIFKLGQPSASVDEGCSNDSAGKWWAVIRDGCGAPDEYELGFKNVGFYTGESPGTVLSGTLTGDPPPDPDGDAAADDLGTTENCDTEGGDFSFVLCPLLRLSNEGIELLDGKINSALQVSPEYYNAPEIEEAWGNFRNVAYILLIPVMLIMVIGTALGFGFVDAYTVKRAMPRLLIAVIFMALSFDIAKILIEVTNEVGRGTAGLAAAPFGGAENLQFQDIFSPGGADDGSFLVGGVAGGLVLVGVGALSIGILATYLAGAALMLIIIFAIITMRELVLLFLMILSPLAILSWIFPGNDKLWKTWWNTFSKLLVVYPFIIGLLVVGRGFAVLVNSVNNSGGIEAIFIILVKLTAFVGPFFFIPKAFQLAGGAFGSLAGTLNDRSKGAFDRMKNYRGNKRKQLWQDAKSGSRFNSPKLDKLNEALAIGTNVNKAGVGGLINPKKGLNRIKSQVVESNDQGRDAMGEDKEFTWKGDDGLTKAAYKTKNEKELRNLLMSDSSYNYVDDDGVLTEAGGANLELDIAKVERMRKKYNTSSFQQATWLASMAGGTAHGKVGNEADIWADLAEIAGTDNSVTATLVAKGRSAALSAGRIDEGGAGFGETFKMVQGLRGVENLSEEDRDAQVIVASKQLRRDVAKGQSEGNKWHASMKPYSVRNQILAVQERLIEIEQMPEGTEKEAARDRELATVANAYDTLVQTAPQLAAELDTNLLNWSPEQGQGIVKTEYNTDKTEGYYVSRTAPEKSTRKRIEERRSSDDFLSRRREITAGERDAQGRLIQPQDPNAGAGGSVQTGLK